MVTLGAAMKIPLEIDDAVLAGARVLARRHGTTVDRIAEEALRMRLAAPSRDGSLPASMPSGGQAEPDPD